MDFVGVLVEELPRAEEVSAVAALDALVWFPLGAADARVVACVLVVARAHLVGGGRVAN